MKSPRPPLPWPLDLIVEAFAKAAGIDPGRLQAMAYGDEPWDSELLRVLAEVLPRKTSLHKRSQVSRVNGHEPDMHDAQRLAISKSRATTPWLKALHERAVTQNQLAKKVGMSPSLLSMCRKGNRPVQRAVANQIASLIDWPADKAHWPGGFIED